MPKFPTSDAAKLRNFVRQFPEFEVNEERLFCPLCICTVNHSKKDNVISHRNTKKHQNGLTSRIAKQPTIETAVSKGSTKANFFDQVTSAFVSADIPLEKLNHPRLRALFESINHPLPSEYASRSRVESLSAANVRAINELLHGKDIFFDDQ